MRIAIYSRKSVETDTGESIKNQIKFCKEYFERQNTECQFEVFEDEGFSGSNIKRPAFQRMMELVKFKQFDVIAVYKVDRIARNIVDFVNIYDELDKLGVKLVSITEGFDPSTPAGKMMMLLLASFAEMERMNIAQRVKDNMNELAKLGRWSGGTAPTGYKTKQIIENGKKITYLEIDHEISDHIKEMFKLYSENYSCHKISKFFEQKGFKYPQKTIQNILSNPTYLISSKESIKYLESQGYVVYGEPNGKGFLPYNRRPKINGKKLWNDKKKFVSVSQHQALIELDLWIKVQEIFKSKSTEPHPRESNFSWLSGGIVKCGICGSSMFIDRGHPRKDGTRINYFRCVNKKYNGSSACNSPGIRVDDLEKYVMEYLKEILKDKQSFLNTFNSSQNSNLKADIAAINRKISANDKAISNLIDKLMLLSNDAAIHVTKKIEELTQYNNILKENLLKLEREQLFQKRDIDNAEILFDQIYYFVNMNADLEIKRQWFKRFASGVNVNYITKEITVDFIDLIK